MNLLAKYRARKARHANDKAGRVTSGRTTSGERDRLFRIRKGR